jgi:hypothetical protein
MRIQASPVAAAPGSEICLHKFGICFHPQEARQSNSVRANAGARNETMI